MLTLVKGFTRLIISDRRKSSSLLCLTLTRNFAKSFKHKPVPPPKPKVPTREDLFGQGGNIPLGGYVILIIPLSTFLLGTWQVFRWRWKLGLIQEMEGKVHALPVEFPVGDLESLHTMEYRKVKVRGKFDYGKELIMGPRQLVHYPPPSPGSGSSSSSASTSFFGKNPDSPTGYHVVTPFLVEDSDTVILVNRGWIPDRMPHKHRFTGGPVEIVGVVRKEEKRQPFMPKDIGRQGMYLTRDIEEMSQLLKTSEAFLDLVSVSGFDLSSARLDNLPVPGQTRVTLRNEHVSYFCTWYSLSGITSYMWYRRFILKLPLK